MSITAEQRKKVKGEGFLSNSDGEHFSGRVITENGVLTAKQMKVLCEAAEKYGNGEIAFTARLTLECPGIPFENITKFQEHIAKESLETGGTGSKVRPVVACKGTYCDNGLVDTLGIAKEIHKRFYEGYRNYTLPHKFKIAVGGCPNNCVKPDLNDIGIVGQSVINYDSSKCKGCNKCAVIDVCPMNAVTLENKKASIDKNICNNCGMCIGKCTFNAIPDGEVGYSVYVGGRWGKKIRHGSVLNKIFTPKEVINIIEKTILLFKSEGLTGERFGTTVDRLGVDKVEKMLISDELLLRKNEVLGIKTEGGARC